jgi:branched-chain amino acid aminotransferase
MMGKSKRLVYMNGQFVPEGEAKVSIFDSALMFGDTVLEMTRSFNGKQFKMREHLERLYRSIKMVKIPVGMTIDEMAEAVVRTEKKNEPAFEPEEERRIVINVSRGPLSIYREIFNGKIEPTVVISIFPLRWTVGPLAHLYDEGVHAVTPPQRMIPAQLLDPKIKNRSRLHYIMANIQVAMVKDPNAWALLLDPDGFVCEGTGSNFFIVKDGKLLTPEPRNILRGVSRQYVLELAGELCIPAEERNLEIYDIAEADEAFFTATPFCMIPCTQINTYGIGNEKMGPITTRLLSEWGKRVGVDIIAQAREFAGRADDDTYGMTNPYRFGEAK